MHAFVPPSPLAPSVVPPPSFHPSLALCLPMLPSRARPGLCSLLKPGKLSWSGFVPTRHSQLVARTSAPPLPTARPPPFPFPSRPFLLARYEPHSLSLVRQRTTSYERQEAHMPYGAVFTGVHGHAVDEAAWQRAQGIQGVGCCGTRSRGELCCLCKSSVHEAERAGGQLRAGNKR